MRQTDCVDAIIAHIGKQSIQTQNQYDPSVKINKNWEMIEERFADAYECSNHGIQFSRGLIIRHFDCLTDPGLQDGGAYTIDNGNQILCVWVEGI